MDHEAHVRLVDAHAEGHGRHDDVGLVTDECLLVVASRIVGEARMVRKGSETLLHEHGRGVVHALPAGAVDDARLSSEPFQDRDELSVAPILLANLVSEIGAVERCPDQKRIPQSEPLGDVLTHPVGSGGRECGYGDLRTYLPDRR